MIRYFYFFLSILILSCSFDNKSGIWDGANNTKNNEINQFKDFETLISSNKNFNEIITLNKNFKFQVNKAKEINNINKVIYNNFINTKNLSLSGFNKTEISRIKLSRAKINKDIIKYKDKIFTSDEKGNLIIFSLK